MTSSLVGSEMCIRDRNKVLSISEVGGATSSQLISLVSVEGPGDGRKAVSYTHLTLPTICSV
eukprot:7362797-Prorocentrum_lima.AAC.1